MESCDSSVYEYDLEDSELDNYEYSIPVQEGSPPSLDSVLKELTDDENIENADLKTLSQRPPSGASSISSKSGNSLECSFLHHVLLQGITSQLYSAADRISAGLPTALAASAAGLVCIGTAHGITLAFDSAQALRWCSREPDHGAVSALSVNNDASRLLAGYERGHIIMFDAQTGDVLRSMPEVHAPQTAVLHLRFADWTNLAFCADSAGCVFSITFARRLGIRTWDSKCLFSGARGEVCAIEPLMNSIPELRSNVLLAMATLSKIIVVSVRPRLRIIFTHLLSGSLASLPLIAWQPLGPILAFARGLELYIYRFVVTSNTIRAIPLRRKLLPKPLLAIHFLSARALSCVDIDERMKLLHARTLQVRETTDISSVGLIYASAHFKALATGGHVSAALAKAGEHACYGSISACGRRLLILGFRGLHSINVRTANERLQYLRDTGKWSEVLRLASISGSRDFTLQLVKEYLSRDLTRDGLEAAILCCVTLNDEATLCDLIWEKVANNEQNKSWYFSILEDHITAGRLTSLAPTVSQALVAFHESNNTLTKLEALLPSLNVACLDLHQLLSACRAHGLHTVSLWLSSTALQDYIGPLVEFLPLLQKGDAKLGNALLVYISCCLAGRAYPRGDLPPDLATIARSQVLCHLLTRPCVLLKALLKHDPHACVSVFELAFVEPDFSDDIGQCRRQQVAKLLLELAESPEQYDAIVSMIARCLLSGMIMKDEDFIKPIENWLRSSNGSPVKERLWLDLLSGDVLAHLSDEELIAMADEAKCFRVKELVLERTHDYCKIVECYLNDNLRKRDIFSYMRKHSKSPNREIRTQLLDRFEELLDIDKESTLKIVAELFPELVIPLSEKLIAKSDVLIELLWAAIKANAPVLSLSNSTHLAALAQEAGDFELAARLLEASGDLSGALELLLRGDAAPQAAALCARAPEPSSLLGNVSDPKMLHRLLKATLSDSSYETLLYETSFKILSKDLHLSLRNELAKAKRGRFASQGTVGCLVHHSTNCTDS